MASNRGKRLRFWLSYQGDSLAMWRMDWFPFRVSEYLGYDDERQEFIWGETHWMGPRFGPIAWLWRRFR